MPQFNSPRFERVFIGSQTSLATVGTLTKLLRTAGANGCKLKPLTPLTPVPWKTGTRSTQPGIPGKKSGTFDLPNMPVILSGTPGTVPDMDLLLQGIFGAAPTIAAGVSVTYAFADNTFVPFTIGRYQHALSTLTSQIAYGCTPEQASFALNGNVFEMSTSGLAYYTLESDTFSGEDTAGKGGLASWPAEIATPTLVGAIQNGFQGIATFDSAVMDPSTAPLIGATLSIRTGNLLYMDNFGTVYASTQGGGERGVSLAVRFQDTDSAALTNLKAKAKSKAPMNITLQVGVTAGSIFTATLKGVQLNVADFSDDNARVIADFGDSPAHASSIANIDDLVITLT